MYFALMSRRENVPDYIYLDTSALIGWVCGLHGSKESRDRACMKHIEALISGDPVLVASPITLAEFSTVLHSLVRDQRGWRKSFDLKAADDAEGKLMRWLAEGDIKVRNLGSRAFEMGMVYVASASREHA